MKPGIRHRSSRGFTMVTGIFILVVLAVLGAAIVTVSTTQHMGSALDIQGARAYQAARAGLEWGIYQVQATPAYNFGHASSDANLRSCASATGSFQPAATTLAEFTVTVSCTATADASGGPTVYTIEAAACSPATGSCPGTVGSVGYVERRLAVSI